MAMDDILDDSLDDKICDVMYCTDCGNNPAMLPRWTGKENWYIGICNTCNTGNAEFVLDPETPEEASGV